MKNNPERFSDNEVEFLIKNYIYYRDNFGLDELVVIMNRSKTTICRKARELGLTDIKHKKRAGQRMLTSKNMKAKHANPHSVFHSKQFHDKQSKHRSKLNTKLWADPNSKYNTKEFREKKSKKMKAHIKNYGHYKGMLDKHHSEKTKIAQSERSKKKTLLASF